MTIKVSGDNANELHKILIEGQDFSIKPLDPNDPIWDWVIGKDDPLLSEVNRVDIEELTTREFGGKGSFDALMESAYEHIKKEYENDRITGDDYAKAYTSIMESAMANATQFALQKDLTFWQSVAGKLQAYTSYIGFQTAKMLYRTQLFDSLNAEARYANTKMDTLTKESMYRTSEWSLDNILPQQHKLLKEQTESERAQTQDIRTDGEIVKGSIGKQKDLYTQQIDSYKRDAEYKVGKYCVDAFITMKTIDEGLKAPNIFTNSSIDTILGNVRKNVGL